MGDVEGRAEVAVEGLQLPQAERVVQRREGRHDERVEHPAAHTLGVELAPGCRMYFLRRDEAGKLTRGTEVRHQGLYGIFDPVPEGKRRRIEVKTLEGGKTTYEVTVYSCPKALVLEEAEPPPGKAPKRVVLLLARETDGGFPGTFP